MNIIDVRNIRKTYHKRTKGETVQAVDDVSFTVKRGEILGLLGPNGAGKTTTIKTICGLLLPDGGRVLINGMDNQHDRHKALQHLAAVLEGNRNLYWRLTARENLEYFAGNRGHSRRSVQSEIDRLLKLFHLETKADELVNSLSRGMQQKLAIAVAMLAQTDIILLDEPTLGLDVETGYEVREHLKRIAREDERTVVLSTHDMPVVQDLCERTVIINEGRVIVNDEVQNLMRLFASRAYCVTLAHPASAHLGNKLSSAFAIVTIRSEAHKSVINVDLESPKDIYKLIGVLEGEGAIIESIDKTSTDFEAVFRKLVSKRVAPPQPQLTLAASHA